MHVGGHHPVERRLVADRLGDRAHPLAVEEREVDLGDLLREHLRVALVVLEQQVAVEDVEVLHVGVLAPHRGVVQRPDLQAAADAEVVQVPEAVLPTVERSVGAGVRHRWSSFVSRRVSGADQPYGVLEQDLGTGVEGVLGRDPLRGAHPLVAAREERVALADDPGQVVLVAPGLHQAAEQRGQVEAGDLVAGDAGAAGGGVHQPVGDEAGEPHVLPVVVEDQPGGGVEGAEVAVVDQPRGHGVGADHAAPAGAVHRDVDAGGPGVAQRAAEDAAGVADEEHVGAGVELRPAGVEQASGRSPAAAAGSRLPHSALTCSDQLWLAAKTWSNPATSSAVTRSGWLMIHSRLTQPGRGATRSRPRSTRTTSS